MTIPQTDLLLPLHREARRLTRLINATPETEPQRQKDLEAQLFGSFGERSYAKPPLYCSFGLTTHLGTKFFCNYGCIFEDRSGITVGDYVMFGPSVLLLADTLPITVGDHVWIGGNTTVCGGAVIGSNVVIGAGSVVTGTIPDNVVAAGNPCRVLRPVTEEDRRFWEEKLEEYRTQCDEPMV